MEYRYAARENFEDLACGRVLIHRTGFPNFPVRLAQEIFCRCLSYLPQFPQREEICLYDPCCGGAYLLTVLGFLNPETISKLIGSDISREAVELARQNLSLLSPQGMKNRIEALRQLSASYGKDSHRESVQSGERLLEKLEQAPRLPRAQVFPRDLFSQASPPGVQADIIFLDVPYGNLAHWQGQASPSQVLDALRSSLKPEGVAAICSDKSQRFSSPHFQRLEKQSVGKRIFQIFRPL